MYSNTLPGTIIASRLSLTVRLSVSESSSTSLSSPQPHHRQIDVCMSAQCMSAVETGGTLQSVLQDALGVMAVVVVGNHRDPAGWVAL